MKTHIALLIAVMACQSGDATNDLGDEVLVPPSGIDGGITAGAEDSGMPTIDAGLVAWTPTTLPKIFDVTWECIHDCACPPDFLDPTEVDYLLPHCNPPGLRFSTSTTNCPKTDAFIARQDSNDPFTWTIPEWGGVNDCDSNAEKFGLKTVQAKQINNNTLVGDITQFGWSVCKKDVPPNRQCQQTWRFTATARH